MADTIREQIITAYLTRLASWKSGFNHFCGGSVIRANPFYDQSKLPVCALWPGVEEVTKEYGNNICTVPLKIEAFAAVGEFDNASEIQEQLLGDAIKIMTDPSVTVTSLTKPCQYVRGGPADAHDPQKTITGIFAEFEIKYQTLLGNPYSQG
jgi:hypothetical protein